MNKRLSGSHTLEAKLVSRVSCSKVQYSGSQPQRLGFNLFLLDVMDAIFIRCFIFCPRSFKYLMYCLPVLCSLKQLYSANISIED